MSDFLTELEEDIREEKLFALWHKYGHFLVGIAVAIVLFTAGYTLWGYFTKKARLERYASFAQGVKLTQHGQKDKALKIFKSLAEQKGGYGVLAQLYEAALSSDSKALYEKIAHDNPTNPSLSNLCKVLIATRFPGSDTVTILEPLSAPQSGWAPLALEFLGFYESQKGNVGKAIGYYTKALQEPYLTPSEKNRIGMTIAQMEIPTGSSIDNRQKK